MTYRITLYTTSACQLCERAEHVLEQARASGAVPLVLERVDVAEDDRLLARYGARIPVLARADGSELDWPFGETALLRWLAQGRGRRVL